MMGLMVLGALAVYLLASIWMTKKAASWAKANNKKPWLWGGLAAFVMYNLVFWDLIPTLVMHKYYCDTQAGFWVYKTPEQWMKDNPELTKEDLKSLGEKTHMGSYQNKEVWSFPYLPFYNKPERHAAMINKRIYLDGVYEKNITSFVPIHKSTTFFADINNDQKLAEEITFGSSYGDPMTTGGIMGLKSWLASTTCNDSAGINRVEYDEFIEKIVSLGNK